MSKQPTPEEYRAVIRELTEALTCVAHSAANVYGALSFPKWRTCAYVRKGRGVNPLVCTHPEEEEV